MALEESAEACFFTIFSAVPENDLFMASAACSCLQFLPDHHASFKLGPAAYFGCIPQYEISGFCFTEEGG